MAIKKIAVPFCDHCGLPWLPKFLLRDGTQNPIFDHPELSKRCGKCKRTGWNAGGVDRRRKRVEPADLGDGGCTERLLDEGPQILEPQELPKERQAVATANTVAATDSTVALSAIRRKPASVVEEIPQVTQQDVIQTIDIAPRAARCRHGLYKCTECHPEKAA